MKNIWIVTANRSWADIFEATSHYHGLNHVKSMVCDNARLSTKNFRKDKPGRIYEPVNCYRHSAGSPHKENEDLLVQFAQDIAHYLNKARDIEKLDGIVIVAAPKVLGLIKKGLTPQTAKILMKTFAKNPKEFSEERVLHYLRESLGPSLFYSA